MRSLKKIISALCVFFIFSAFATFTAFAEDFSENWPDNFLEVFNIRFDSDSIAFGLSEEDDFLIAFFIDERRVELHFLICDTSEADALKKMAFESKTLVKSVYKRSDYENKNIYSQIVNKFKNFAALTEERYGFTSPFGFVKTNFYKTRTFSEKHPEIDSFYYSGEDEKKVKSSASDLKLLVWSYTDELETIINKYYTYDHPEVEIEYSLTPTDQFQTKLEPPLRLGQNCPDVFTLDSAFVKEYVNSGYLLPLDDIYEEIKDTTVNFPAEIASANGHVYALSWYACPGAMIYRRSLAKKYLGTDDPEIVQKYFSDVSKLKNTARLLKSKSNGNCRIVSSPEDLFVVYKGARTKPWIVNDKLFIDPVMEEYMEMYKSLCDEEMSGNCSQWSEAWFAGMRGDLRDSNGRPLEIFCYMFPTWGFQYVLKPNSPYLSGAWAMCEGPSAWQWGGTWIAASKDSKNPKLAKEMIKYIVSDPDFLEKYAKDCTELVVSPEALEKAKSTFNDAYLGGQNSSEIFIKQAQKVNGTLIQETDTLIEGFFMEAIEAYARGEKSKDRALQYFKEEVSELGYKY